MSDYKDTINLPATDFPMRGNLAKREPDLIAYWDEIGLYQKLREQGAIFEYEPSPQSRIIRGFRSRFCGSWEPRHGFEAGETLRCN